MTTICYPAYTTSNKPKSSLTELCFAGLVGFLGTMGTGSSQSQRDISENAAFVVPVSGKKEGLDTAEKPIPLAINEQIELVRNSFGLNISAMAELLTVSRPTVYAWLKGEPPKLSEHISHIDFLVRQASAYVELNLDRPDNFIKRPLFGEDSLFSLLKSKTTISLSQYRLIKKLDLKESKTRAIGLKKHELRTSDDVLDDLA